MNTIYDYSTRYSFYTCSVSLLILIWSTLWLWPMCWCCDVPMCLYNKWFSVGVLCMFLCLFFSFFSRSVFCSPFDIFYRLFQSNLPSLPLSPGWWCLCDVNYFCGEWKKKRKTKHQTSLLMTSNDEYFQRSKDRNEEKVCCERAYCALRKPKNTQVYQQKPMKCMIWNIQRWNIEKALQELFDWRFFPFLSHFQCVCLVFFLFVHIFFEALHCH